MGRLALHGHAPPVEAMSFGNKLKELFLKETGFEPADILEAPVHPPELRNVRPAASRLQLILIVVGAVAAAVGLICFLSSQAPVFGAILTILGVAAITMSVLVRIGHQLP